MKINQKILQGLAAIVLATVACAAWATPQTTYYVYDEAGHVIGEYNANGNAIQEHIYLGDRPVAVVQGGSVGYVTTDQLNTPRVITNASQTIEWSWAGDPFGNGQPTGSLIYNLRFPGQYYDAETGHYYNYMRDYDPVVGRYIESDLIGLYGGGPNTYSYVLDNPIKFKDETGLKAQMCCRPLASILGTIANHCYFNVDGNTYGLYPRNTSVWGLIGIPRYDDPRDTGGQCTECKAKKPCENPGQCIAAASANYAIGAYSYFGPNSNTFAATVANSCCSGGASGLPSGPRLNVGSGSAPPPPLW